MMQEHSSAFNAVNWDFPDSSRNEDLHALHPYPAKFIPEIPRHLLRILSLPKNSWVLDPFCGSGVTLVEAQKYGVPSIGIDLHPIACLISKAKTQCPQNDLCDVAHDLVVQAQAIEKQIGIPTIPNLSHWFEEQVQRELAALIDQIDAVACGDLKHLLRFAFSSLIVRVSNQESDTRYAAIKKNFNRGDVYKFFLAACERIKTAKYNYAPKAWECSILQKNILHVTPDEIAKPIGLVITSPPYPNAYEYWLYHKYRMYWLGYDPIEVKRQEIGARAHYFKTKPSTVEEFCIQMEQLMRLLSEVIVKDGHACIVIGRSKIHGELIDNSAILIQAATQHGFQFLTKVERTISQSRKSFNLSHANIKSEDILIFRK